MFIDILMSETLFPSLKAIELHGILGVSDYTWQWGGEDRGTTNQLPLISKLASRATINRIAVRIGEDRRQGGGMPAGWVLWEQANREVVRITEDVLLFHSVADVFCF